MGDAASALLTAAPSNSAAVVMASTGRTLTYGELEDQSARLANVLESHSLPPGSPVALLLSNSPEYFVAYWAILRAGHRVTTLSSHLTASEARYIVDDSNAATLIVGVEHGHVASNLLQATGVQLRLVVGGDLDGHLNFAETLASVDAIRDADEPIGNELLYSSGTTGSPKGILRPIDPAAHPDARTFPLARVMADDLGFASGDVYLSPAPLYHASPLRFCVAVHVLGGTVVLQEKFDAEGALAAIARHRVTHSQWVPTMFVRLLQLSPNTRDSYDLSSHRVALHSAAPCPDATKRAMVGWWGSILWDFYGASEAFGRALLSPQEWIERPGSVGRPDPTTVKICDEAGNQQAAGSLGTIYFHDPRAFEYLGDPAKTAQGRHPQDESWVTVGDVGRLDSDGYLYLADRQSFVIISGGVNIYPQEIENRLAEHAGVADSVVVGATDVDFGEVVVAFVEPEPAVRDDPSLIESIYDHLRHHLARFKHPKRLYLVDAVPRTPTGKPDVTTLRRRAHELTTASPNDSPGRKGVPMAHSEPVDAEDNRSLLVSDVDGIRTITFNRPDVHNAQDLDMLHRLDEELDRVVDDPSVRVVVIAGAGKSFCAGHDLKQLRENAHYAHNFETVEGRLRQELRWFVQPVEKLRRLPVPTICRVQGHCLAAGLMFASAADFVIASDDATFGSPVLRHMGVNEAEVPNFALKVGETWAKRVFWLDERMTADDAKDAGLATWVTTIDELDKRVDALATSLANAPREALALSKDVLLFMAEARGEHQVNRYHFLSHQISHATAESGAILSRRLERLSTGRSVIPDHPTRDRSTHTPPK